MKIMFHKRKKKTFAPGTFIATPARVAAIIHLCLAFTLLLWITSQPFMGDLFAIKSELLLYDSVFDQPELIAKLPPDQHQDLVLGHEALKKKMQLSFGEKFKSMLRLLLLYTPPLELAWLFFSLIIPVMLLMRIEGAAQACWILPVITLAYAVDNHMYAPSFQGHLDRDLFPTEEFITHHYLDAPLSNTIFEQQEQLTKGWQRFLIESWAGEAPADDATIFKQQLVKGEFAFNVARLQLRKNTPLLAIDIKPSKKSFVILGLYLAWNLLFAIIVLRKL